MWKTAVAAVLALAAGATAAVWVAGRWMPPEEPAIPEWTRLPNGLRFRAQRIERTKQVAVMTVFAIGSDSDPEDRAGLAHLAEHLYCTSAAGAEPSRTVDEWNERYKDRCDASTHETYTSIVGVVGRQGLEHELKDVAARMSDLRIEQSDLDREQPRVLEQIAEHLDSPVPWARARRVAHARLHPVPNDGHGEGIAAEVERLTLDDLREFARRAYCPANARIAVVGDIDPAEVTALVTRIFASLPAGEPTRYMLPGAPDIGDVRIDRGASPGPGYERCHGVCIAYLFCPEDDSDRAALAALGTWGKPGATPSDWMIVLPDDRSICVVWQGDERPAEDVTKAFDALVDEFAHHAAGDAAADRIRSAMRDFQKAAKSMREAGVPMQDPFAIDEGTRLIWAAQALAVSTSPLNDWKPVLAKVERLTNDDIRRFVAKWHVAERRVVVDDRGWTRSSPPGDDEKTTKSGRLPVFSTIPDVRVTLIWDETTQTVHRKLGDREYADDAELQKAIAAAHDALDKDGHADAPVTIDADSRVAWNCVIGVVNIIKRCGIDKIEFAMGEAPKKQPPK